MDDMQKSGETPKDILAKLANVHSEAKMGQGVRRSITSFQERLIAVTWWETGAANLKCRGGMQPPCSS